MFQIQKIRAHIQLMQNRRIKLVAHRASITESLDADPAKVTFKDRDRVQEVDRQIARMDHQIRQYTEKLARFESLARDSSADNRG